VLLSKSKTSKIIYLYVFVVLNCLGLLGVLKYVLETKGLTMNEIYMKFIKDGNKGNHESEMASDDEE